MTETTQGRKTGHALKRHILQSNHTTTIIPLHSTVITQSSHKRVAFQSSHCQHKEWPLLYIHSLWRITLHTRLAWLHRQDKDSNRPYILFKANRHQINCIKIPSLVLYAGVDALMASNSKRKGLETARFTFNFAALNFIRAWIFSNPFLASHKISRETFDRCPKSPPNTWNKQHDVHDTNEWVDVP